MHITPWRRLLALYWAFVWRAALTGLGLMLAFYLLAAPLEAALRIPPLKATLFDFGMLLALLLLSMGLALRAAIARDYSGFRLRWTHEQVADP